jgi:transcription antitermination factor NusG
MTDIHSFSTAGLEAAPPALSKDWYAVRVKSNFEQIASTCLESKGLSTFLPTYKDRRKWSDRVKDIQVPLFPGYVFCQLDPQKTLPVVTTPGVAGIVSFGKELAVVNEGELQSVRAVLQASLGAKPWPYLESGRKILIKHGPLRGVEGIVLEHSGSVKLVVSITLLQRSVSVEVERGWVEAVNGER